MLGVLKRHGDPAWASVEGTNVVPNGVAGEPTMETYLGRMFNRGAVLVNIFAWGVGPSEGPDAIAGYRAFPDGRILREVPAEPFGLSALQEKLLLL